MFHRRLIDFAWEITHDRYYLLWRLSPRWVKRIWIGTPDISPDIDDSDLLSLDELYREFGVEDGSDELEG